jgi:hypothetical protein
MSPTIKRSILFKMAKIMNTLHGQAQPMYHGHLSSHNIFIELPSQAEAV